MDTKDLVALLVSKAMEAGMLAEVVHAYGEYRARGDKPSAAVSCALWDFDIDLAG